MSEPKVVPYDANGTCLPSVRDADPPHPVRTSGWTPSPLPADVAAPAPVRAPYRVLAGLLAAMFMAFPVFAVDQSLYVRAVFFLGGVVFGGLALLPGGRVDRFVPRPKPSGRLWLPPSFHDARD
ncbi:MAG: hypothetical protein JO306_07685 [Gemmatimonadetes bacterium]|nr:hypothetical protein [Gemmatimonadota bacterium]